MKHLIAVALATGLVAAACGTGDESVEAPPLVTSPPSSSSSAPPTTTDTVPPSSTVSPSSSSTTLPLPPVTIEQVDCPQELAADDLSCGLATVPLDRDDPGAGTTRISLVALPGTDPDAAMPMAVLQGGPGGSSSELTLFYPRREFTQVFVDQRGTGFGTSDFDCPEVDAALAEILASTSESAESVELAAYDRCADRLADDPVVGTTDTRAHAADVADVMTALGYDQWLVYGVSYGTTIALELMRSAPPALTGAVLDSVYPPDLDIDVALAESAAGALEELDRSCAADPDCDAILSDVAGTLDSLIDRLDDEPIIVGLDGNETLLGEDVDMVVDGEVLAGTVFRFLYSESRLRFLPGVLDGLERGDPATARWLARAVVDLSVLSLASNDDGTWFAVQCADRLPFTAGPPAGLSDFVAAIVVPGIEELCEPWAREPADPVAAEPVTSDLPTLIVGGQFDPITPPAYADRVSAGLTSVTVAIRPGRAHGVWFGDDCIASLVDAFVADPDSAIDTSCADDPVPVDWRRPVGG